MPEPKIIYEKIEGKTQRGLIVRAPSWERLYINAALALTDSLVEISRVRTETRMQISVTASSLSGLMEKWLQAVLDLFNEHQFLSHRIVFDSFNGTAIKATLHGEPHDRIQHGSINKTKIATVPKLETGDSPAPEPAFFVQFFLTETIEVPETTHESKANSR